MELVAAFQPALHKKARPGHSPLSPPPSPPHQFLRLSFLCSQERPLPLPRGVHLRELVCGVACARDTAWVAGLQPGHGPGGCETAGHSVAACSSSRGFTVQGGGGGDFLPCATLAPGASVGRHFLS